MKLFVLHLEVPCCPVGRSDVLRLLIASEKPAAIMGENSHLLRSKTKSFGDEASGSFKSF